MKIYFALAAAGGWNIKELEERVVYLYLSCMIKEI
jgi:hypothetical protein